MWMSGVFVAIQTKGALVFRPQRQIRDSQRSGMIKVISEKGFSIRAALQRCR
jgi:hypothetical protein